MRLKEKEMYVLVPVKVQRYRFSKEICSVESPSFEEVSHIIAEYGVDGVIGTTAKECEYFLSEAIDAVDEWRELNGSDYVETIDEAECKASGQHLKHCDKDGFCNNCGYQ